MDNGTGDGTGDGNDMINGSGQMLTSEISEMNDLSTVLPSNDRQQSWYQPVQGAWSLPPFPGTGPNASFPSDLNSGGLAQWAMDPDERERVQGALSSAPTEDTFSSLPATVAPRVERWSCASQRDVNPSDRTASSLASQSLASQSPASSRSSQEDHVTELHSSFIKESLATKRLIQVYFEEVHPYWPLLHAPTFDIGNAPHILVGSMIVLANWLEGELDHMKLAPLVFDAVTATVLVRYTSFMGL